MKDSESKLRDLEWKISTLQEEKDHWQFRKTVKLRELLEKPFVMRKRDLGAVFLVDYLGKPIERGDEFERATKAALGFGRKAATAETAIKEIDQVLDRKGQITPDERAVLIAAARILKDIHHKSTIIKESAKIDGQRIKREEAAREKAANEAVSATFPKLADELMVLCYFLSDRSNYHFERLRKMRPETLDVWDLNYQLDNLERDIRYALRGRVEKAMKDGKQSNEAAQAIRDAFEAARDEITAAHVAVLENYSACRVAAVLLTANRQEA